MFNDCYGLVQQFSIDAGIDECTEEHVAANSGKAFKISNSHKVQKSKAATGIERCTVANADKSIEG